MEQQERRTGEGRRVGTADPFEQGRASFARRAWRDAYTHLVAADRDEPLGPGDLERLAMAAYLIGRDQESADVWTRAHHEFAERGDTARAARCAFWLGFFALITWGEPARSSGWLARGQRLLDDGQLDCVERGYLLVPSALQALWRGDPQTARSVFEQAWSIGKRFRELDLVAFGQLGQGQALMLLGDVPGGMSLLDEVMVSITADEVSTLPAGIVYCAVIEACQHTFDVRRAREWTSALTHWCAAQPDLVPYRGSCLVHRSEIMLLRGAWPDAMDEAQRARELLSQTTGRTWVGDAIYQQAELHRLRGEFGRGEAAYREASHAGLEPQPGLALLRLAQGQVDTAAATIRRALDEARDHLRRSRLLPAYVEITLAAGDVQAARPASDELAEIATSLDAPLLRAVAAHATGAVLLAEGEARAALQGLRQAWAAWQELQAPYEAARVRALIGLACRALGDEDTAEMELDAARWAFQQLGAMPDVARVEALSRNATSSSTGGLTAREVEVLRLLAAGKTNRAIAADLVLSEKTVARHVSNIFAKLDLSSRAAATAYAYEHGLV